MIKTIYQYIKLYLFTERAKWFRWYSGKKKNKEIKNVLNKKYYTKIYNKKIVKGNLLLPCKSDVNFNSNLHFKYFDKLIWEREHSLESNVGFLRRIFQFKSCYFFQSTGYLKQGDLNLNILN